MYFTTPPRFYGTNKNRESYTAEQHLVCRNKITVKLHALFFQRYFTLQNICIIIYNRVPFRLQIKQIVIKVIVVKLP